MTYRLTELDIDRVDLVDEGANSAAHIELYKRKESITPMTVEEILSKMKPEHAEVVSKALSDKDLTINDLSVQLKDAVEKSAEVPCEPAAPSEEDIIKSMPESAREMFTEMKKQRDAAEAMVRKAAEEKRTAEAIAKANALKALPVPQETLVEVVKNCDAATLEVLTAASNALEGVVLGEVGKNRGNGATDTSVATNAWANIEAKADEIAKARNISHEMAVTAAVTENPALYRAYLEGGAN